MTRLVICGSSTRAAAESAARAGFSVTAIDAFADLDQHPNVLAIAASPGATAFPTALALARGARTVDCDAAAYVSPFENHPRAVATLASGRALWGNTPETLRAVRDPFHVAEVLGRHGFKVPRLSHPSNHSHPANDSWLVKPFHSGGGNRIRPWRGGSIARGSYLQERVDATPASVVFVAAKRECVPVGLSRQLVGDPAFGASGFRYCGSILASTDDRQFEQGRPLLDAALRLAQVVTSEFGLVGLNGIDFLAQDGSPVLLEVNPRWSSSVEVAERAFRTTFFQAHADACCTGALTSFDLPERLERTSAFGKAIVYAREDCYVIDSSHWLADPDVRDVPRRGQRFKTGQPVCSVFATAQDGASCHRALVTRAELIYRQLAQCAPVRAVPPPGRIASCAN